MTLDCMSAGKQSHCPHIPPPSMPDLKIRRRPLAILFLCATQLNGQSPARASDSVWTAAFDRLDRTSQTILWTIGCAQGIGAARRKGVFGPVDSVGQLGQCFRQDGRTFGAFFNPDSTFTRADHLSVIEVASGGLYPGRVDTARMLALTSGRTWEHSRPFTDPVGNEFGLYEEPQ